MHRNIRRTVCTAENTTESRSVISHDGEAKSISISLKVGGGDMNRRQRRFLLQCTIHHISQGQ